MIVTVGERAVEVQLRTEVQHLWAQLVERFADFLGRGIRYGEPPNPIPGISERTALRSVEFMQRASATSARIERAEVEVVEQEWMETVAELKDEASHQMREMLSLLYVGESEA